MNVKHHKASAIQRSPEYKSFNAQMGGGKQSIDGRVFMPIKVQSFFSSDLNFRKSYYIESGSRATSKFAPTPPYLCHTDYSDYLKYVLTSSRTFPLVQMRVKSGTDKDGLVASGPAGPTLVGPLFGSKMRECLDDSY